MGADKNAFVPSYLTTIHPTHVDIASSAFTIPDTLSSTPTPQYDSGKYGPENAILSSFVTTTLSGETSASSTVALPLMVNYDDTYSDKTDSTNTMASTAPSSGAEVNTIYPDTVSKEDIGVQSSLNATNISNTLTADESDASVETRGSFSYIFASPTIMPLPLANDVDTSAATLQVASSVPYVNDVDTSSATLRVASPVPFVNDVYTSSVILRVASPVPFVNDVDTSSATLRVASPVPFASDVDTSSATLRSASSVPFVNDVDTSSVILRVASPVPFVPSSTLRVSSNSNDVFSHDVLAGRGYGTTSAVPSAESSDTIEEDFSGSGDYFEQYIDFRNAFATGGGMESHFRFQF